jgi:acetyl-CoA carboxylase carboxyl transferase subunit alpha
VTSADLVDLKIIDKVIPEPPSGAHTHPRQAAETVKQEILAALKELKQKPVDLLLHERLNKYRRMGVFTE